MVESRIITRQALRVLPARTRFAKSDSKAETARAVSLPTLRELELTRKERERERERESESESG